jgi:hypothetical protein
MCPHATVYVSSYYCICVLILLYMCPHATVYVSSYYCICVLILLYMCPHALLTLVSSVLKNIVGLLQEFDAVHVPIEVRSLYMCPYTTIYVSSYYYICVLILLYIGTCRSSTPYMCR